MPKPRSRPLVGKCIRFHSPQGPIIGKVLKYQVPLPQEYELRTVLVRWIRLERETEKETTVLVRNIIEILDGHSVYWDYNPDAPNELVLILGPGDIYRRAIVFYEDAVSAANDAVAYGYIRPAQGNQLQRHPMCTALPRKAVARFPIPGLSIREKFT